MLQNIKEILVSAQINKCAIPQFNINNLEWTKFILEACNENNSPVILGVSEGAIKYMGGYITVSNMVKGLIEDLNIKIPVSLHLDHGSSIESCKNAIDADFTSIMIDASKYSLEKNIEITKEVVNYAHSKNVIVEAEIGSIGEEDGCSNNYAYAKVDDAIKLVNNTNIDLLAPAVGTVHGLYKGEPKINFELIKSISKNTNLPLVLHGGSGLNDEILKKSIDNGICKININTELQIIWTNCIKKYINESDVYDPRKINKSAEESMKKFIADKIKLFKTIHTFR